MLDEKLIADYQASRAPDVDRSVLCHAPFTSLNFDQHGRARVCCYNWRARLGTWPEMSVAELWSSAQAASLRQSFLDGTEGYGCELCFEQLRARNFRGTLMQNFDRLSLAEGYRPGLTSHSPRVIELELSNTCNLECVQCQGKWSSLIRKNRDHLPPLPNPYDEAFIDQLEPYLPSLVEVRFLGGEPMLIRLYHLLWERIRAVNPAIVLSITTNGTVIPERPFRALAGLRSHICISIDSLDPDNYARIRKHASLDVVLANVERWRKYTQERGTGLSLAVCPMVYNWRDLPEFLRFSEQHEVPVFFNTVVRPWSSSLASLTHTELDEVIEYLAPHQPAQGQANESVWAGLAGQLRSWRETRGALDQRFPGLVAGVRAAARSHSALLDRRVGDDRAELIADAIARLLANSWLEGDVGARELASGLVEMTPPGHTEDALPTQQTVLLRVLILLRNLGYLATTAPLTAAGIENSRLARELEILERLKDRPDQPIDWPAMWDLIASCDRVASNWNLLAQWVERLLDQAGAQTSRPLNSPPS